MNGATAMMKAIGYIRVSTEEQATVGVSLQAQREKIEAYAKLYDLELVEIIVDGGQSAKSLDRPGLDRALGMLRGRKADGLVVAKLDRLTRSVADLNCLIEGYFSEKAGRQLWSVADSIDTRSAAGRLVLNILASVSQWEREAIGERTKDALQSKRRRGERVGAVPFGFRLDQDGVRLVEDPEEQEVLHLVEELRARGLSTRAIVAELNVRGIPAKNGGQWHQTQIVRILKGAA
jgi:DNA invertase Pin-like site-specific DNA recombinase